MRRRLIKLRNLCLVVLDKGQRGNLCVRLPSIRNLCSQAPHDLLGKALGIRARGLHATRERAVRRPKRFDLLGRGASSNTDLDSLEMGAGGKHVCQISPLEGLVVAQALNEVVGRKEADGLPHGFDRPAVLAHRKHGL